MPLGAIQGHPPIFTENDHVLGCPGHLVRPEPHSEGFAGNGCRLWGHKGPKPPEALPLVVSCAIVSSLGSEGGAQHTEASQH